MDKTTNDDQLITLCRQLSGPAQDIDRLSLCDHNPDILALFIERLDHSSPADVANTLYNLLKEISALNVPPLQKLALLNVVHPLALRCAEHLSKAALSPKTAKSISLAQALLKHLATGFRTVVAGMCSNGIDNLPVQPLIQAITHALEIQGIMYLKSLQFYLDTPRRFWADTHLLYVIAEHCDIPTQQEGNPALTIRCHYTRLLLLACCNPNQLPASDLQRVFQNLPTWVRTASLTDDDSTLFVVDTASDLPPFYRSRLSGREAPESSDVRGFSLKRVVNYLEGKLYNNPDAATIDNIARRLVNHLCHSWSVESTRQSERSSKQNTVTLVYGLSYTHSALANANFELFLNNLSSVNTDQPADKFQLQPVDQSIGKVVANYGSHHDIWSNAPDVARQKNQIEPAVTSMSLSGAANKDSDHSSHDYLQAALANASEQGICIEFDRKEHPRVMPGEVICCRDTDQHDWRLGLVRWKRITPHLHMQLGIELFSLTPEPRAARVLRRDKAAGPYLPALLLTPTKGGPPQILLPVMPFKQGDRIHLLGGKRGVVTTLSVPIDTTSHISRYSLDNNLDNSNTQKS